MHFWIKEYVQRSKLQKKIILINSHVRIRRQNCWHCFVNYSHIIDCCQMEIKYFSMINTSIRNFCKSNTFPIVNLSKFSWHFFFTRVVSDTHNLLFFCQLSKWFFIGIFKNCEKLVYPYPFQHVRLVLVIREK